MKLYRPSGFQCFDGVTGLDFNVAQGARLVCYRTNNFRLSFTLEGEVVGSWIDIQAIEEVICQNWNPLAKNFFLDFGEFEFVECPGCLFHLFINENPEGIGPPTRIMIDPFMASGFSDPFLEELQTGGGFINPPPLGF